MGKIKLSACIRVLVCGLLCLWLVSAEVLAKNVTASMWPVSVARDGFSVEEAATVRQHFAPFKLATAGNQALYTYLNMAEFFPHHLVARQGGVRSLPLKPNADLMALQVSSALGEVSVESLLEDPRSRLQGLIVVHRGEIVLEHYPGMREEDSHLWWSVAKVPAGVLIEQLVDEGKLKLNVSVASYLPGFKKTAWARVTVGQVLNMCSGIDALDTPEGYANPDSGIGRLIYAEAILTRAGHEPLGHDQALRSMVLAQEPGSRYEYSSANTNILSLLIERVTGMRYSEVLQERIWSKIGAEGDALMGLTPEGRAIAHGMFSSRLRDLARFGLLFTPGGHNPAVIPASALKRLATYKNGQRAYLNAPLAVKKAQALLGAAPVAAPSQWDALFSDGDLFKSGYDGQALYVSPSREVVIAMYSTSREKSAYRLLRPIAEYFSD
ncbi:MAG: hypothetical protein CMN82_01195 [Spongiibacter sp.]|nr:hypothetical protein [Spongiibacter sp.]MBI57645.1 hypothetical protein [Spongiibacter sp.]|tara:strand:- start:35661 stop:36977 length:1317 start_codon:yes stop_codon:yes gene_type:complete